MGKKQRFFTDKEKRVRPITSRQPHVGTLQKGTANLGIPKRLSNEKLKAEKLKEDEKLKLQKAALLKNEKAEVKDEKKETETKQKPEEVFREHAKDELRQRREEDEKLLNNPQKQPLSKQSRATAKAPEMSQNINEQEAQHAQQEMVNEMMKAKAAQRARE
jgi:hypothetical protein